MKTYDIPDDLSIPDWLKVKNREPVEVQSKAIPLATRGEEPDPLSALSVASRERVEGLIKSGRFRPHWMEEGPSRVAWIEEETLRIERKKALSSSLNYERLRNLPPKPKSIKRIFGEGTKIKVLKEVSARKKGSTAAAIYLEMVAWVKANPGSDLASLISATRYTKGFYLADLDMGNIKADV